MKRIGFFTGKIYDENHDVSKIGECCLMFSEDSCSIDHKELKKRCDGCHCCPESRKEGLI